MIKAGIVGGGGYTAGELIRILWTHPQVDLAFVFSNSQGGRYLNEVHEDLLFTEGYKFSSEIDECDVLFLCQGHGKAKEFMAKTKVSNDTLVIDLGNDFRLESEQTQDWVYGLPEVNRELIRTSKRIANCGCFATAIQLALCPLSFNRELTENIHISAITGSTGAGQSLKPTTHFTLRNNNISTYKVFSHQHEAEIYQTIKQLQADYSGRLMFVPYRGDLTSGNLATSYTGSNKSIVEIEKMYNDYYRDHPFVKISTTPISLKSVVNTNYCNIHFSKHNDTVVVQSAIDNLGKGASGQAVQNMNLAMGLVETTGLILKPVAY